MSETDKNSRLLLVDDDLRFCQILSKALRRRGFEVRVAHNQADCLALAEDFAVDYAVVDLRIGEESGLEVVEQLHAHHPAARILVRQLRLRFL